MATLQPSVKAIVVAFQLVIKVIVIIVMLPSSIQAIVVVIDCNIQSKTLRPLLCMVFLGLRIF
jgi:hypothetical protein